MTDVDMGAVISATQQYGDDRAAEASAAADAKVIELSIALSAEKASTTTQRLAIDKLILERDDWREKYETHMATHPAEGPTAAQQSIGIQVFPDRQDLSYWDHDSTFSMLEQIAVKNVRGGVGPATTQRTIDFYNRIYDELGIQSCLTVGKPRDPLTAAEWDKTTAVLDAMRGVRRLSNWNEPNHNRNGTGPALTGWQGMAITHGKAMWDRYADDYTLTSAQLWSGNKATHDADLKSLAAATSGGVKYADTFHEIAWHLYQSGVDRMKQYETLYRSLFGDRPIVCTETGMSTAPNQQQGAASMTEAGQADYIKAHLQMYLDAGHDVYWFELRDEFDPDGTDREDWLGIFRHDGTPKPAAAALRELLTA